MFDARVLIKRLPSFSVPKITVIRHVKPMNFKVAVNVAEPLVPLKSFFLVKRVPIAARIPLINTTESRHKTGKHNRQKCISACGYTQGAVYFRMCKFTLLCDFLRVEKCISACGFTQGTVNYRRRRYTI